MLSVVQLRAEKDRGPHEVHSTVLNNNTGLSSISRFSNFRSE